METKKDSKQARNKAVEMFKAGLGYKTSVSGFERPYSETGKA